MKCPLCGYYMASLDTECLRCHGKGLGKRAPDAALTGTPLPGNPIDPSQDAAAMPARFVPPHAVPQSGGADARANKALRDDPILAELNRNPRRVSLATGHGLSFTTIFVLFFVVFVALPWGCSAIFMRPQKSPDLNFPADTGTNTGDSHDENQAAKENTTTSRIPASPHPRLVRVPLHHWHQPLLH